MTKLRAKIMAETQKTEDLVKQFYQAFDRLSGEEKLYFLAEMDKQLYGKSEKEKKLYLTLIKSAREKRTCEQAISELNKV